jgi:hypothetical protein
MDQEKKKCGQLEIGEEEDKPWFLPVYEVERKR